MLAKFLVIVVVVLACALHDAQASGSREEKAKELMQLLKQHGLTPEHLKLDVVESETSAYGLAVRATEDIEPKDLLLALPKKLTIRSSSLGEIFPHALNHAMLLTESTYMLEIATTLVLLYEKHVNKDTIWGPYLALLPTPDQLKTHSLYWSDAALTELRGSSWTVNKVNAHREAVEIAHHICQDLTKAGTLSLSLVEETASPKTLMVPEACTVEEVRWALAVVLSRVWKSVENDRAYGFLMPLFDLFGHKRVGLVVSTNADGAYELHANRKFAKGDEIFTSYGAKPTFLTVTDYGKLPNLEEWTLQVASYFTSNTPFGALQTTLLQALGCIDHPFELDLAENLTTGGLVDYLACRRIEQLTPNEYAKFHSVNMTYNDLRRVAHSVISLENEMRTLRKLKNDIHTALNAYSTKIDEDEKLLASGNLTDDVRLAISLRRAEKYVWLFTLKKLDKMWLRFVR